MKRFPTLATLGFSLALAGGSLALSGCSANFNGVLPVGSQTPIGNIKGVVHGGQAPIVGAEIFLFQVGTSTYGGHSVSLLNASGNTFYETGTGNYYALTDSTGQFNISGDYTCTAGQVVYLYSINGAPGIVGGGSYGNNPAASLMAVLGQCPSGGTFGGRIPYVYMNEVSTVATAFAMAAYATDSKDISIGPPDNNFSASYTGLALTGLQNAAQNANLLYDIGGSDPVQGARSTTPIGNGVVPAALINGLANVLAGCINSTGPSTTGCTSLFSNVAKTKGGQTPIETATAAITIAQNPGTSVSVIYGLGPATVFTPNWTSQPNDFTVAITYTSSGIVNPTDIAIDAGGNAWVTSAGSTNKVTRLSPTGLDTSYTVTGPNYIAIDTTAGGYVWMTAPNSFGAGNDNLYKEPNAGGSATVYHNVYGSSYLDAATGIVNDGTSNYIADTGNNRIVKTTSLGVADPTNPVNTDASLAAVDYLALDTQGYLWATAETTGSVCRSTVFAGACTVATGFTKPERIAIDSSNYAWIADASATTPKLNRVVGTLTTASINPGGGFSGGGLNLPFGVAIDGNNVVWVANTGNNSISEFTLASGAITPSTGFTFGATTTLGHKNLAIDGSGDIWLANSTASSVTEIIGVASPTTTPLSAAASNSALGKKP
jgi:sugar lactone lactonase YvrE